MINNTQDKVSTLYHVRRTIGKMLQDRGYLVAKEEFELTLDEFKKKFYNDLTANQEPKRDLLTTMARKPTVPGSNEQDSIFVFFSDDQKLGVKSIRKYHDRMKEEQVNRAIIVIQGGMTAFAKQALQELGSKCNMEWFTETELLINITEHVLVPRHTLLSDDEKKQLLVRYQLRETQLPRILHTDPVARYYGLRRGQVVKIVRPSETAGRYVTYRYVL